jgi:Putative DNA-binding domain
MLPLEEELASYAARFAAALIDPARATPALVSGPNGKAAVRRYNVYRNNVTVSLIDALAAVYPAVQRITGVEFFRAMARFHVRATPPTSPLLFDYGRDFLAFIETYEFARTMPWLADVARIERAWLDAYHAADAAPLSTDALALVPPERLADVVFTAHPATRIVRSHFSAVTIFAANRGEGVSGQIDAGTPEDALVTRPEMEVVVRQLPEGGAVFLTGLMSGQTLGVAAASALQSSASFEIAANIAGMIEAGAFTSISFGEA